ncbi:MAG: ABC transporter ATP-binding protein [Beijerinckiaceae bacterium]
MSAVLELRNVSKQFSRGGLFSRQGVMAVNAVSFSIAQDKPEIFTIIGESGSGKSTLARMILGIHAPTSGELLVGGRSVTERIRTDRMGFMRDVQPIFQNPFEAFNPLTRIDRYLFLTAQRFGGASDGTAAEGAADDALKLVGLSLAEIRGRFPHEMSGGQLQRTAIARALLARPRLIVADEPVSMVDASLRMSIVNLFAELRDRLGLSIIYITHDLATAYYISDRLIIMQKGEVVEAGDARTVLAAPQHPYSQTLRNAVLTPDSIGLFTPSRTDTINRLETPQ